MFIAISVMFVAAAACIIAFIIAAPQGIPVLAGQRWQVPGLGNILIIETNITSSSMPAVKYQLASGEFGYCSKYEIRYMGKLLPYSKNAQREIYINKILHAVRERNQREDSSWKSYSPPPGWVKPQSPEDDIFDAEIVEPEPDDSDKDIDKRNLSISKDDDFTRL